MAAKRFTFELERVGKTATMSRVPSDPKEAFGVYDGVRHVVVNRDAHRIATTVERVRERLPQR